MDDGIRGCIIESEFEFFLLFFGYNVIKWDKKEGTNAFERS